ncbi:MAG: hypothetical protein V1776_01930 [Candidatus Diapherotrites archaeon]
MTLFLQAMETINSSLLGNWGWLGIGIAFVIVALIVLYFLKNVIVNTVLGLLGWGILVYVFNVQLPFWPSLIVSAIFGLAGLGAMLVLSVLGILV